MRPIPKELTAPVEFIIDSINSIDIDICVQGDIAKPVIWFWNSKRQNYNVRFACPSSLESRNKFAFVCLVTDKRVNSSCNNGEYIHKMHTPYIRRRDDTSLDFLIYSRTVGIL